jgi:hypothetical protein
LTIWKCVHIMNFNIVEYLTIIWMCVNIIMWIWIMHEFEFKIFNYSLNLYLLNGVGWRKVADIIDLSLVSAGFHRPTPKILWLTPSRGFFVSVALWQSTPMMDLWCRSISADTKNRPFFISYKGYRICWATPKMGYQPAL